MNRMIRSLIITTGKDRISVTVEFEGGISRNIGEIDISKGRIGDSYRIGEPTDFMTLKKSLEYSSQKGMEAAFEVISIKPESKEP